MLFLNAVVVLALVLVAVVVAVVIHMADCSAFVGTITGLHRNWRWDSLD